MLDESLQILLAVAHAQPQPMLGVNASEWDAARRRLPHIGHNGALYVYIQLNGTQVERIVAPTARRKPLLRELHARHHVGGGKLALLAAALAWWPSIVDDAADIVRACHTCQLARQSPPPGVIGDSEDDAEPRAPNDAWQIDSVKFDGDGVSAPRGRYLAAVDIYSGFTVFTPIRDASSSEAMRALRDSIIVPFGTPARFRVDGGREFLAGFAALADAHGIAVKRGRRDVHTGQQRMERAHRTVRDIVARMRLSDTLAGRQRRELDEYVRATVAAANDAPSLEASHLSPFELSQAVH